MNQTSVILIFVQLAVFLCLAIFNPLFEPLNRFIRRVVGEKRAARLRPLMILSHRYNDTLAVSVQLLLFASLIGLGWRDWRRATILTLSVFAQIAIIIVFKKLSAIDRPPQEQFPFYMKSGSYPSGHSSTSMTFALMIPTILAPYVPAVLIAIVTAYLAGVALITAYGRLFLDVHWLTDIIGGWLLSGAAYMLCRGFMI